MATTAKVPARPAVKAGSDLAGDGEAKARVAQDQVRRLAEARARVDVLTKERSRIAGELGAVQKRLGELEAKCKADFDCSVEELPDLVSRMEAEAEQALAQAEGVLGMREVPEEEALAEA